MLFCKDKKRIQDLADILSTLKEKITALEKENIRMRAMLNSMVEGVIAVAQDTKILSVNPAIEKIFNISQREAEGKFFLEAVRNNDIYEVINVVIDKGEFVAKELTIVWPIQRTVQINASPIFDDNTVSGCLIVIHDITQIKRLEIMRRDFVANVSHELKTPLTSIKGFVETLLEGALEDKDNSRHFLQIIHGHTERLDKLVNDLLKLSHLESQGTTLAKERVNLKDLTEDILASFKSPLKRKSLQTENILSEELVVDADKDKIEQVLTNLIDNAIKFNREKGWIKIYSQDLDDTVKFVVEDSGIGIPAKDISRIFERFYRVDKARSRELGGTGLGLSIAKHIVELHGGSVGVESTEGFGSKFYFYLPK